MSKRFITWGVAALLVVGFAGFAQADVPIGNHDGVNLIDHLTANAAPAPAEAIRIDARQHPDINLQGTTDAGCQFLANGCLIPFYIWSIPGTANARTQIAEGLVPDPGFSATPCTLMTTYVLIYDWIDTLFKTESRARVRVTGDDGAGRPDEGVVYAETLLTVAEMQTSVDLFDFVVTDWTTGTPIVIPAGDAFHIVVDCPGATPGIHGIFTLSDGGTDDAAACPEGAANTRGSVFYTDVGVWESHATHFSGFQFGSFFAADVCCEAPPPDCFTLTNSCLIPFYIWSVPGTANARIAMGESYVLDPTGTRACTLASVDVIIYDWIDPLIMDDVRVRVVGDDGFGLPNEADLRTTETITAAVADANLFALGGGFINVPMSTLVTAGAGERLHVIMDVPAAVPGTSGIFLLSDGGTDDAAACPEGAGSINGSVFYTDVGVWESHATHFGGFQFGNIWLANVCCPPLLFALCTPGADADWATQGNNFARTNYSAASMTSLCGLQTLWNTDFAGDVLGQSAVIAGPYVVVSSTDNIHCLDRATGLPLWSLGGFPYIIGELRGAPTIDLAADRVYFAGAGAQSFTACTLSTGGVDWSRNLGGTDPPFVPLSPGQTNWTPSVIIGSVIYFMQETGNIYALDVATGLDIVGSPLAMPDAPNAVPYNGLTSDGVAKLWVGTANTVGTDGNIHQIDAATMTVDWTLTNPGFIFTGDPVFYDPEGFPGTMAYEDGILYYHSQIRNDGNGFARFPATGSVGAIDVAGPTVIWANDANAQTAASPGLTPSGSYGFGGPALGPGMLYIGSRGFFGGTTEQDGISAWDKSVGTRIWYQGYTDIGNSGGVQVLDDVRSCAAPTVFCQPDQTPYLLTGHVGGSIRLFNGNNGNQEWMRTTTGRTRQIAVTDDFAVAVVRNGNPTNGGGSVIAMSVQGDRPRLQIDSLFVFRTATPGDGVATNDVTDALQNTGCLDLNATYANVAPPLAVSVSTEHPSLVRSANYVTASLDGYDSFLGVPAKVLAIEKTDLQTEEDESMVRTFANTVNAAADPLFLTAVAGPAVVAPGATGNVTLTYDETGLTNNTGYINYIEVATDDPDYYPQGLVDPTGSTTPGVPVIEVNLFIGCPDAQATMTVGLGTIWVNNFGAGAGGGNFGSLPDNFVVNGNDVNMFDGGWALVVQDSVHWAFDGCSVSGYPRRAGEFGPTLPCGVTVNASSVLNPLGGTDNYEDVTYKMLDLASTNGFFPPSSRQCGGVELDVQRVASQDAAFGDFVMTAITLTNEPGDPGDIVGSLPDVFFGGVTDWDISGNDNLYTYPAGYAQADNGAGPKSAATWATGHSRLDANMEGAGPLGSGGSATFMSADMQNDQGHGNRAFQMVSDPENYCDSIDPVSCVNTDIAALWVMFYTPSLDEGTPQTFYHCVYQLENGGNATWASDAEFDAEVADVMARASGFAGFGKGDVNGDGVVDLADVVLCGNIVDGLFDPIGTAGMYTADVDSDGDIDETDYNTLYDVVAGVQPPSVFVNAWRF